MKIGKITSIDYDKFKVRILNDTRNSALNIDGTVYYFGNIGSYLKVENSIGEVIICEVISIVDGSFEKSDTNKFDVRNNTDLIVKPIGTIDKKEKFYLGVGIFPSIYSDVYIVVKEDLETILGSSIKSDQSDKIHTHFEIGLSKNLINYPVSINIDNFFNIHSAVLGNSGSGKSNTVAHILQEIFEKHNHMALGAKVILFDVNGEYSNALKHFDGDHFKVKQFKPNRKSEEDGESFFLPHYLLSIDEWCSFLLASEATQRPFWDMVLQECFRFYKIKTGNEEERAKFINYMRFKLCSITKNILNRTDSDTSNITTVANALSKIKEILESMDFAGEEKVQELIADIDKLISACVLVFGKNDGKVSAEVIKIDKKINIEDATSIYSHKLKYGQYYDYKFLKIASELTLLEEDAKGRGRIREYTSTMMTRLDYFLYNPECAFMRDSNSYETLATYISKCLGVDDDTKHSQLIIIDSSELGPDTLELLTSVLSRLLFDNRKKKNGEDRKKSPIHLVLDEAHRYINRNSQYILKENIFDKIAREGRKFSYYLLISSQRPSELSETVLSQCGNFIIHRIQNERDLKYVSAILPYYSEAFTNKIKQSVPGEGLIFGNCVPMPLHIRITKATPEPSSQNCEVSKEWFVEN